MTTGPTQQSDQTAVTQSRTMTPAAVTCDGETGSVTEIETADRMLASLTFEDHAVRRFSPGSGLDAFHRLIRRRAHAQQINIRTALFDNHVLAIALADAPIWNTPIAEIRGSVCRTH